VTVKPESYELGNNLIKSEKEKERRREGEKGGEIEREQERERERERVGSSRQFGQINQRNWQKRYLEEDPQIVPLLAQLQQGHRPS